MTTYSEEYPLNLLDVSDLPESAMDSRDPVWWGNLLGILIETTSVAILIASYFYLKRNFSQWPPPRVSQMPFIPDPNPELFFSSVNLGLLIFGCLLMYLTDILGARKLNRGVSIIGLGAMLIITAACIYCRYREFGYLHVRWDDNTYGSLVWWMLSLHMTYLIAALAELFILEFWLLTHELEPHHALDITLAGGYFYWTAGTWVLLYLVVYWTPRWL